MKLSAYSKNFLMNTMANESLSKEWADILFNYVVHGYSPGGFFSAVLANDFSVAITRSHPANNIQAMKHMVRWITSYLPDGVARGSWAAVDNWLKMTPEQRRVALENAKLIYSAETEMLKTLKGELTHEQLFVY